MQWSQVCGLSFSYLTNLTWERHIKATANFAERILGDHQHLSKARSPKATGSRFKLLLRQSAAGVKGFERLPQLYGTHAGSKAFA